MTTEDWDWTPRLLRAAVWVGRVLSPAGESRARARLSWTRLPLGGEVDLTELEVAQTALLAAGLVQEEGGRLVPNTRFAAACALAEEEARMSLLAILLEEGRPLWLTTAGNADELRAELVPEPAARLLEALINDPARRESFLLTRARTVEAAALKEMGEAGEAAVVEACRLELASHGRHDLAALVRQVSVVSDELGYDVVAPRLDGTSRRLEVKATRSLSDEVHVYVSRNEMLTGLSDPDWALVVVRLRDPEPVIAGHAAANMLEPLLPSDGHVRGRWQSARLRLDIRGLQQGLPPTVTAVS